MLKIGDFARVANVIGSYNMAMYTDAFKAIVPESVFYIYDSVK